MELTQYNANTDKLVSAVGKLQIVSAGDYNEGAKFRAIIKERIRRIEGARVVMVKPYNDKVKSYNDKVKEINKLFKEEVAPLNDLLITLDGSMLQFKQKEAIEVQAKMLEAKKNEVIEAPERTVKTEKGTTTLRKIWKGRVVNRDLVYRKYPDFFVIDQQKVDQMARVIQAEREIDGVEIYFEETLSTRI